MMKLMVVVAVIMVMMAVMVVVVAVMMFIFVVSRGYDGVVMLISMTSDPTEATEG